MEIITDIESHELHGGDTPTKRYIANRRIADKVINPNHPLFGKKGESWYIKKEDKWYFQPKGSEDIFIMNWYSLDSNVEVEERFPCIYKGTNKALFGSVGNIYFNRDSSWIFEVPVAHTKDATKEEIQELTEENSYRIQSPEVVELLEV